MNFYKRPLHHNNSPSANSSSMNPTLSSSSTTATTTANQANSSLNGSVRFNDLVSAQPKFNDREKYLTA